MPCRAIGIESSHLREVFKREHELTTGDSAPKVSGLFLNGLGSPMQLTRTTNTWSSLKQGQALCYVPTGDNSYRVED
jgi:hypothetical protein